MPRSSSIVLPLLVVALLAGCTDAADPTASPAGSAAPSSTPPSSTATSSPDETPPAAAATMPTDCTTVVDAPTYAATFGETPLNDPALQYPYGLGAIVPAAPPAGATTDEIITSAVELRCIWRYVEADISFLSLEAGRVPDGAAQARLDELAASGYTCIDVLEGRQCQRVGTNDQYPVEEGDTQFVRDDVLIRIEQANVPTNGLMAAVVARIWK